MVILLILFSSVNAQILVKENAIPKVFKYKPIPIAYKEATNKALNDLINKNLIEPVTHSDWASPIVLVLKKNNEVRICADFRYVNSQINVEKFPLPAFELMLEIVGNNKIYNSLDLLIFKYLLLNQIYLLLQHLRDYLDINVYLLG